MAERISKSGIVASTRVGDNATVKILSIDYEAILTCDRDCHYIKQSWNGSLKCALDHVKSLANFKNTVLLVDYEVIVDRDASENWEVFDSEFKVIDDKGHIHEGEVVCEEMISPQQEASGRETLYPGTRATFRIFYKSFPKKGKISSIVIDKSYDEKSRINLEDVVEDDSEQLETEGIRESGKYDRNVFNPRNPGDLFERMDRLEQALRELQDQMKKLSEEKKVDFNASVEIPIVKERIQEGKVSVHTLSELQSLSPRDFREVVIGLLQGQGFKNIETKSDPEVGFSSMIGTRFGTTYAIYAIPYSMRKPEVELIKVQWLLRFQKTHNREKAIFFTSGTFSHEAESEASSNNVELIDKSRMATMLSLRDADSFGYKPLQH